MASLLPNFVHTPRTKRKLSSMEKTGLEEIELGPSKSGVSMMTKNLALGGIGGRSRTWRELFASIDPKELFGFIVFEALTVFIAALCVLDWIFFFKFVVEPEDLGAKAKWGGVWLVFTFSVLYFRALVRSKVDATIRTAAEHAELFIAVSMVMIFAINIAFFMHTPSATPLRDLGFMLVPEQAVDSKWRPVSDLLTAVVPVLFLVQAHFMHREYRCRIMMTFFRCASICYGLRACTIALTSLPGPAPHCRLGSADYFPPQTWIDVVTRVGPMFGNYNSCGDLIFSGHLAYTTTAVLLYLRELDRLFPRHSRVRWVLGMCYLFVIGCLCISGRKHYTVDLLLGFIIAFNVYFHFEYSWTPLWLMTSTQATLSQRFPQVVAPPPYNSKTYLIELDAERLDDLEAGDAKNTLLSSSAQPRPSAQSAEFIC